MSLLKSLILCLRSVVCCARPEVIEKLEFVTVFTQALGYLPPNPPASCSTPLWQEQISSQAWKCFMGIMAEAITVCSSKCTEGLTVWAKCSILDWLCICALSNKMRVKSIGQHGSSSHLSVPLIKRGGKTAKLRFLQPKANVEKNPYAFF